MNYKLYENVLDVEFIDNLLSRINENNYNDGMTGGRVNLKHKNRKDLFINDVKLLSLIDDKIYTNLYEDVKINFKDIKYREKWKLGKYLGDNNSHYSSHRDDTIDVAYRTVSMIVALSDPSDYEGGELCFDELNVSLKLNQGSIVVFKSSVLHHVNPVTSGNRIVLISFFFDDDGRKIKKEISKITNFSAYKPILSNMQLVYTEIDDNNEKIDMLKFKGDIDYADKSIEHPWNDEDDFWFEDNDSDILLVPFAGMGWKQSIPTFIFYNFLKSYTNIDKLFIRDINCRYYITGLKNTTGDLEDTIEILRKKISHKKYKKVVAIGCSAGGFAAILFGQLLQFDKVIAFSPQTVIDDKKDSLIGDIYNAPKTCQWLRSLFTENAFYHKCLDLRNFAPFKTPIDIHYSVNGNKGIDKKHALYLEGDSCKIFEHPGNDHMIALTLRNKGELKEIIDKEIVM